MSTGVFDTRGARQSLGSNASGSSRRHSLLSVEGSPVAATYDIATAWGDDGDAASRWRRAYIASETGDATGVQSTSLALPDEARFTTCMAMSSDQPLVAVGSGSYETNMFFVQTLDDQLDVKASFASKFPIYSLAFKDNLLMAGTDRSTSVLYRVDRARLLGFSGEGEDGPLVRCVGTFKNKAAKSIDIAAPGNYVPTKRVACVEFAPAYAPGSSWPPASVGAGAELFLSCLGGVLNVWDAAHSQQALRVEKVSGQPLSRATWSPHAPATLVAAAGIDGMVSVMDLRRRGKAVAWRSRQPEGLGGGAAGAWLGGEMGADSGVADVAWSPYAPYWLATGGEGAQACVWDLRFAAADGAGVAALRHPTSHGAIRSVAWSATHADLVATGTSGKALWLHSLRTTEDGAAVRAAVVADRRAADDIGSVVALSGKGTAFFSLSSCGDVYAHRVTQGALAKAAVHQGEPAKELDGETLRRDEAEALRGVESAVYARDLNAAAEAVLRLVPRLKSDPMAHADCIRLLCDLFKAKPRIAQGSWALPPPPATTALADGGAAPSVEARDGVGAADVREGAQATEALRVFAADLRQLAYGLPPGFPLEATASRLPVVWQALEQLNMANLRVRLERMVAAADAGTEKDADGRPAWKGIADRERQIMQYVKAEPQLFDPRLLRAVVKLILPHDCIRGLTLGLGICQAYLSNQRMHEHDAASSSAPAITCTDLDGLVHVLLFPTLFDLDTSGNGAADSDAMAARSVAAPTVQLVRERIGECLAACPEAVFEMVRLEITIQQTVLHGNGEQKKVAADIVAAMHSHAQAVRVLLANTGSESSRARIQIHPTYPATTTMSASAVRLYLNSLLSTRAYEEHLINTQWWRMPPPAVPADEAHVIGSDRGWPSSFPLARVLNRQAAVAIVPRLQRQIDVVLATIKKEPLGLEPRLYRDTLLKVARVAVLMQGESVLTFVTDVATKATPTAPAASTRQTVCTALDRGMLATVFEDVGGAFLMLLEALTRHTSHRDAFKRAASEAAPLRESLAELLVLGTDAQKAFLRQPAVAAAPGFEQMAEQSKAQIMSIRKYLRKLDAYTKDHQLEQHPQPPPQGHPEEEDLQ
ncbi:hypothetical protein H4R20_000143 [Coemansia guatemalensis]|uniref:Uncharacterized protein n=1 Tax=Coemansia guatemalensis TaxID=2761395 RepID=A0A9W8HZI9_9FUNG|nr:hypothetical protein H4R20_000143 [Coemansia guatemalensis]